MYHYLSEIELKKAQIKELKKDDILFHEGAVCTCVGIVNKGELRIISSSQSSKDIVYGTVKEGGIFGNNLIFSREQTFRGDVIACKDTIVYLFSEKDLLEVLETNRAFLRYYLAKQSETIKNMNLTIRLLSIESCSERLLYMIRSHHGELPYRSVTDLARTLHLSREALSRTIGQLERDGMIVRGDHLLSIRKR